MDKLFLNTFIWCANTFCGTRYRSKVKGVFTDLYLEKIDKAKATGKQREFKIWVEGWLRKVK